MCPLCLFLCNDDCFQDVTPTAFAVFAQVKVRVRFYLILLFMSFLSSRRRRYFARHWGARDVVACVRDGLLVVLL